MDLSSGRISNRAPTAKLPSSCLYLHRKPLLDTVACGAIDDKNVWSATRRDCCLQHPLPGRGRTGNPALSSAPPPRATEKPPSLAGRSVTRARSRLGARTDTYPQSSVDALRRLQPEVRNTGARTPRCCTTNAASDFVCPADIGRIDGTYRIFPLPHALE
jgi:hypothetical protein